MQRSLVRNYEPIFVENGQMPPQDRRVLENLSTITGPRGTTGPRLPVLLVGAYSSASREIFKGSCIAGADLASCLVGSDWLGHHRRVSTIGIFNAGS